MDEYIQILEEICDSNLRDKDELQSLVNQNLFQIEKINSYLKSLFEKEDPEFKVFSPRNIESIYDEQISTNQSEKDKLEKQNISYYKKINVLEKQINQLSYVIESLKCARDNNSLSNDVLNNDSNQNKVDDNDIILSQHISHRIMNCVSYIDYDPERAKNELKAIAKKYVFL